VVGCCECGTEPSSSIKCRVWLLSCTVLLYCWEAFFLLIMYTLASVMILFLKSNALFFARILYTEFTSQIQYIMVTPMWSVDY
jgi:hypothetical protein